MTYEPLPDKWEDEPWPLDDPFKQDLSLSKEFLSQDYKIAKPILPIHPISVEEAKEVIMKYDYGFIKTSKKITDMTY